MPGHLVSNVGSVPDEHESRSIEFACNQRDAGSRNGQRRYTRENVGLRNETCACSVLVASMKILPV
jgi:hypothetical protein